MLVDVDTSDRGGPMLAEQPRTEPVAQTGVYADLDRGAEAEVARIIAANAGSGAKGAPRNGKPAASASPSAGAHQG
jgi:hypothetical protein